jgi:hypothetical protein
MIHLQVRDEKFRVVVRGTRGLDWSTVGDLDHTRYPLLGSLVPFADTMFNFLQAERLRREVSEKLIREALGEELALEIERLCHQVENGSHLYLWFVGD